MTLSLTKPRKTLFGKIIGSSQPRPDEWPFLPSHMGYCLAIGRYHHGVGGGVWDKFGQNDCECSTRLCVRRTTASAVVPRCISFGRWNAQIDLLSNESNECCIAMGECFWQSGNLTSLKIPRCHVWSVTVIQENKNIGCASDQVLHMEDNKTEKRDGKRSFQANMFVFVKWCGEAD